MLHITWIVPMDWGIWNFHHMQLGPVSVTREMIISEYYTHANGPWCRRFPFMLDILVFLGMLYLVTPTLLLDSEISIQ